MKSADRCLHRPFAPCPALFSRGRPAGRRHRRPQGAAAGPFAGRAGRGQAKIEWRLLLPGASGPRL